MSLSTIRARLAAASPGPWKWTAYGLIYSGESPSRGTHVCSIHGWRDCPKGGEITDQVAANGALVGCLPTDLALLLEVGDVGAAVVEAYRKNVPYTEWPPHIRALEQSLAAVERAQ